MTFTSNQKKIIPQILQRIIIITALFTVCLGVFFRFYHLEEKIYWLDESFTSISVSAHSWREIESQIITGQEIDISTLQKYQFPNQNDYLKTVQGLIKDEPQHTPLYFLSAKFWLNTWGNSIFIIRSFSALVGILCLPLIYLLCQELFNQPLISWIATAFMAVSPFQVMYAQEARPFSLWTLTTLLSCLALLKAQKKSSFLGWLFYSLTLIISFYTFLFSLLTCFAHFIYILISEKIKFNKNTIYFCLASILATLCFVPWLFIISQDPPSNYTSEPPSSLIAYPKAWVRNLSLPFADFNINENSSLNILIPFAIYLLFLLVILAYSFIYLGRNSNKKAYFFLTSLLFIPFLIILLHDFGKGGQMSIRASYLIPSLLSMQIMFSYLLGDNILQTNRTFWLSLTGIFLIIAIASCSFMTTSNVWWLKDQENVHHQLAAKINQAEKPLIISDVLTEDEYVRPFSLSHYLKPTTKFMFLFEPTEGKQWQNFTIPASYSDIFLYAPSESLKAKLVKNYGYTLVPLFEPDNIYCDCPDEKFFRLEANQN